MKGNNHGNGNPDKTGAMAPKGGSGGNITMVKEMRPDGARTTSHGDPYPHGLANPNPGSKRSNPGRY